MSPLRDRLVDVGASGTSFDSWFAATLRDAFEVAAGGHADFGDIARHTVAPRLQARPAWPLSIADLRLCLPDSAGGSIDSGSSLGGGLDARSRDPRPLGRLA